MRSLPASLLARTWRTAEARALFGGVAAHAMRDMATPFSSAIGMALATAAHRYGWPVAEGGSASISDAMIRALEGFGGKVTAGTRNDSLDQLGTADVVMLDLTPAAAARIIGDRLHRRVMRAFTRYRHGPGVFKVDYAIDGHVPWVHAMSRRAGTVHLGAFTNADAQVTGARGTAKRRG